MAVPLVNGEAYSYVQITTVALGIQFPGMQAITYVEEQEKTDNPGQGNRVVSRGRSTIIANGSIDLSMNDIEAIRNAAPDGSLLKIPAFDIVVVFGNPQSPVTHVLKNVEFMNDGVETSHGDTDIVRTFDLIISHVKFR